ncbi:hypothetical protein M4I32_02270 [Microbacterium sp. LRZ72]|uniref:hypothetical protein n=1 Tax=Microbacterium sp. LRZ72 TaxID=2942481 RepID=UPI0029A68960|nr:hypothetical protein [Microbacterium sp. LRZ72]MDX2375622.1 hypothetical protein [Microbacterium sp. LRZ72]
MADLAALCSNHWECPFTAGELRKLAVPGDEGEGLSVPTVYKPHELSRRFGAAKVEELVQRARTGESVRSLARELDVASSALTRMLREQGVEISKRQVTDDEATSLAAEYEDGATMAELEKMYSLSHGAVLRSLHRSGVTMRASAPRRTSTSSTTR